MPAFSIFLPYFQPRRFCFCQSAPFEPTHLAVCSPPTFVSHASVHDPKKAVEVYEEMLSKGLEPDQRTASHMIVAHSRGEHDAMYRSACFSVS